MLGFSALELARLQFAFTVSFHIIFPAITIGLASYLAVLETLWLIRRNPVYVELYHFWSKIFAVNFGMGVVSGLVMAYEFGTNWSGFSQFAGGVTGPLLTYEVLTAFFLEAGFLGVMLFGWNKVGPGLHMFATAMVALGTLISTTWILASNSWMQTPQGFEIINGKVVPTDWLAVIFNPSFPFRLAHMTLAAYLSTALFVAAAAAWHLLRGRSTPAIRKMFSMSLWMLIIVAPVQMFVGDAHGLNTLEHQPAKIAAIEGHWENDPNATNLPLIAFGVPDMAAEETKYAIEIPYLGSLILTHTLHGKIPGLKEFAPQDRPNSTIIFFTFRIMVGLGLAMFLLGVWGAFQRWRGKLYDTRPFLLFALFMGPTGLIAVLAGWITTEVGRQPWVVYGILRTQDAVSNHAVLTLTITLVMFIVMYFLIFGTGIGFMLRMVAHGPDEGRGGTSPQHEGQINRPARPLSAVPDTINAAPMRETTEV
ncbi:MULTISPECIES: cytochrome ubiquinol oxidase subunit I [Agrobacterium]|jgi:cytochrome d ubiquinol oxidase subunit I|uniref:cytochrome ubiquinol oxidase subunit I n=1 Tax=Agrobacterium TaxID=357 RepID=UPI000DDA80EC|nr:MULTISPECIES: cytochrome ubiquinol oxidase subunit I [Agrobacterium]MDP9759171.1 cytochrome d ubiquinol oxidase subunit I [Agrobacterium tumefaciens]MDQ1223599.1 cytochrome d ubiquinol oxidase subunit I [Agrobacterium sp. SORGH_AS_0745]QTQ85901.1 cytochrome ubiquinol oxidase subunit I [Agrobacterium tumefaciens]WCK68803.1 cytochrome ubiquinol oxidase subunit I [Agrobacterium tumefaciens]